MRHVQENIDDQINRRNDMWHWEKTRFVSFEISIRWKVRQCNSVSQKDFNENDFLKLTFAMKTLFIKNDQLTEKDWWNWNNSKKCFENDSMRYVCDFKDALSDSTNIVNEND
jgi:hypothetical protein